MLGRRTRAGVSTGSVGETVGRDGARGLSASTGSRRARRLAATRRHPTTRLTIATTAGKNSKNSTHPRYHLARSSSISSFVRRSASVFVNQPSLVRLAIAARTCCA